MRPGSLYSAGLVSAHLHQNVLWLNRMRGRSSWLLSAQTTDTVVAESCNCMRYIRAMPLCVTHVA